MKHISARTFATLSVAILLALLATSAITPDLGSVVVQAAPLPSPEGGSDGAVGDDDSGGIRIVGNDGYFVGLGAKIDISLRRDLGTK